jgi:hypothetical protein
MDAAEEWCTISRALQIITNELRTSTGVAQTRLIEACAAGNVRSRVPRRTAGDGISPMGSALINFVSRAGPLSPPIWKGAVIDGDSLLDWSRSRWSPVEINVADLNFDLASAEPVAPTTIPARVVSHEGGRPTDAPRVIEEAKRRLDSGEPLPSSLAGFARELHEWLEVQPNVLRGSKTTKVLSAETIKQRVRPLWSEHRKKH